MKTIGWIVGLLGIIGFLGYIERGWFDIKGMAVIALLLIPTVIAIRSE